MRKTKNPLSCPVEKTGFWHDNRFIIAAFIVPFVLMSVAFACYNVAPFGMLKTMVDYVANGIGHLFPGLGIDVTPNASNPWGDKQMLVIDLWHQYFPFLHDLQSKLQSGGSLLYSWSFGMGVNYLSVMSYYLLSPLNFLSIVVPESWLVEYLALATVIKISCMGMFTAIALRIITKKNSGALVFFSLCFSLCAFTMGYYWCVIWLDSVAMLPLAVAGTVALLRDGKFKLFTISLACAVIFNYYIGLFVCVAVFLTAVGYTVSRWVSIKKTLLDILKTLICSVSALAMTAIVTLPAYLGLQNCYRSTYGMPTRFDINIGEDTANGVFVAIQQILSNTLSFIKPTDRDGLPNVACGILCIILAVVFLCSRKIKLGEKLFCTLTLVFFVASFIFRQLDFMWHGFHFPNQLPYRFSFLFSFLLIYMAYRAYTLLEHSSFIDVIIAALVFVLIVLGYLWRGEAEDISNGALYGSIAMGAVFLVLLLLFTLKILPRKALAWLLCIVVIGEMTATAIIGVSTVTVTTMSGYPSNEANMKTVLSYMADAEKNNTDIYRTETTGTQTLNDGALNSYNGISAFNSMADVSVTKYVEAMGLGGWQAGNRYTYYESSPVTNLLMNLKYIIARDGKYYNSYVDPATTAGSVVLLRNTNYLPMGFMTDSDLAEFDAPESAANPFEVQNRFWQLATGISEPVYTQLTVTDQGHTDASQLSVTKSEEGYYSVTPLDTAADIHTKFNYYLEEDSLVFAYCSATNMEDDYVDIMINDETQSARGTSRPHILTVGEYKKGDKISLYTDIKTGQSSSMRVFCYTLNKEVFEQGYQLLSQSTLRATKATDTSLEGVINVKSSGLFFTSIPYEKGWTVYVDGEKTEVIPVGGSMLAFDLVAGTHKIKISYIPDGFLLGLAAFVFGLAILVFLSLVMSKKMPDNKLRRATAFFILPYTPPINPQPVLWDDYGDVPPGDIADEPYDEAPADTEYVAPFGAAPDADTCTEIWDNITDYAAQDIDACTDVADTADDTVQEPEAPADASDATADDTEQTEN